MSAAFGTKPALFGQLTPEERDAVGAALPALLRMVALHDAP
jgi:hypothetical protein